MEEEVSIKVNIADRVFPLTVKVSEEPRVREAAKRINEKIRGYKEQFQIEEKQVLLSMCCLQFVTELLESEGRQKSADIELSQEIAGIHTLLDKYLPPN
ncbi:MAG: cell division protein ZapA [Bacteroidia bacterium]